MRPCVACGLAPGNTAAPILNFSAATRGYGGKRILWLALSLCSSCLLDAARSGAISNLDGLRESLRGLSALSSG
jgi:hypothetical protein